MDERSRRPKHSPKRAPQAQEARILAVRDDHPVWGARKIAHVLRRDSGIILAPSTVNSILRRHGRISAEAGRAATAYIVASNRNDTVLARLAVLSVLSSARRLVSFLFETTISASNTRGRTRCGRWISKAISPCKTGGAAIR